MPVREKRKYDHIREALASYHIHKDYFEDIKLIPLVSAALDYSDIDLSLELFGKQLAAPLLINAMTGGAPGLEKYNEAFARAAMDNGIALAVGSQKAGLNKEEVVSSYKIVRQIYPKGLIFANLSALESTDDMQRAIEMIEADALQLHINPAQELSMPEGERNFSHLLKNIEKAVKKIDLPIIIKETGTGLSKEAVKDFYDLGIRYFDTGSYGGCNFALIEERRKGLQEALLSQIGMPGPMSILENRVAAPDAFIFASGGLRKSIQLVKGLVLGADMLGIASYFLKTYSEEGQPVLSAKIGEMLWEMKEIFLLLGFKNLEQAKTGAYILTNEMKEWADQRL